MSYISHAALTRFTDVEMLDAILEDCNRANKPPFRNTHGARPLYIDNALYAAYEVLPEGKGKRALQYVIEHPCAEFHFGGTDAVGPAIKQGLDILKKMRIQELCKKTA